MPATARSTISWSRSRIAIGTSSRRRKRAASCVAIRPAPTIPTFLTGRASASWTADVLLGPPLDQVVGVERRLRLPAREQLGDGVFLAGVALLDAPTRSGAFDQVEGDVGRAASRRGASRPAGGVPSRPPRLLGRVQGPGPWTWLFEPCEQERDRLVEELGRLEHRVGEPELDAPRRPPSSRFWRSGFVTISRIAASDSGDPRNELCPAPRRKQAEEDLREPEVADRRGDRPVVAVERDLEAAAQAGAVDRGQGGVRAAPRCG